MARERRCDRVLCTRIHCTGGLGVSRLKLSVASIALHSFPHSAPPGGSPFASVRGVLFRARLVTRGRWPSGKSRRPLTSSSPASDEDVGQFDVGFLSLGRGWLDLRHRHSYPKIGVPCLGCALPGVELELHGCLSFLHSAPPGGSPFASVQGVLFQACPVTRGRWPSGRSRRP